MTLIHEEVNDGILALEETRIAGIPLQAVDASHTFIMNRAAVAEDIVRTVAALQKGQAVSAVA